MRGIRRPEINDVHFRLQFQSETYDSLVRLLGFFLLSATPIRVGHIHSEGLASQSL